uniref:Uncharacterized protein n=1 Tax=Romanomermis culicivorax TaxID=13658 RepID=A0A915IX22_ROMCU
MTLAVQFSGVSVQYRVFYKLHDRTDSAIEYNPTMKISPHDPENGADFKGVTSSWLTLVKRSHEVEIPLHVFSVEHMLNIRVILRFAKRILTHTFSDDDLFQIKIRPKEKKDNDRKLLIHGESCQEDKTHETSCKIELSVDQVIEHESGTFLLKRLGGELRRDNMDDFFKNSPLQMSTSPYSCHNESAYCEMLKEFCGLVKPTTPDSSYYYHIDCSECMGTTPSERAARWPTATWSLYRVCYTCTKDRKSEKDRFRIFCPKCFYDGKHFNHEWKMLVLTSRMTDRARLKKIVKLRKGFEVWRERYAVRLYVDGSPSRIRDGYPTSQSPFII